MYFEFWKKLIKCSFFVSFSRYIKEGSCVSVIGMLRRNGEVAMIVEPPELSTGCLWRKLLLPVDVDGMILGVPEIEDTVNHSNSWWNDPWGSRDRGYCESLKFSATFRTVICDPRGKCRHVVGLEPVLQINFTRVFLPQFFPFISLPESSVLIVPQVVKLPASNRWSYIYVVFLGECMLAVKLLLVEGKVVKSEYEI